MTNPTVLRRRKCGRWDTPASIRVMQFMLSTTYLVLIVYSYVHRGWWMYRKLLKVLALGCAYSLVPSRTVLPLGFANPQSSLSNQWALAS